MDFLPDPGEGQEGTPSLFSCLIAEKSKANLFFSSS